MILKRILLPDLFQCDGLVPLGKLVSRFDICWFIVIIHGFAFEKMPSQESIFNLVEKTFHNTQCKQFTLTAESTMCNDCGYFTIGIKNKCEKCSSKNIDYISRIVGYYTRVSGWNSSKKEEFKLRIRDTL